MKETICAISTPPGIGAIAIVRTSGEESFRIASSLFHHLDVTAMPAQAARFAELFDGDALLDQVVVTKYAAPRSYTGEDMVEISCHGSLYIQKRIVELLVERGCRLAEPGEFTQRAFLHGKLDLPQAEAVADLIESQSETTHKLAIGQLRGDFSKRLSALRERFVQMASLLELELDFSEEEVEFADRSELLALLDELDGEVGRLIRSFKAGNVLKRGVPVAIVGQPNVGKSTLLNAILQHDRAIVSPIPGTTRDTVEDTFVIDGTLFRFIDTAGLRQSDDTLENIGIDRTYQALAEASVVLYLVDVTLTSLADLKAEMEEFRQQVNLNEKEIIPVANKIDELETLPCDYKEWHDMGVIFVSAKRRVNLGDIEERLSQYVQQHKIQDLTIITNERHYALLCEVEETIARIRQGLESQLPTDLVAEEVRAALHDIGLLTGSVSTDELLDNIFGKFCIGK
ncbi:MAG: tRNA uridine-5-carboxymethylaminomethyl(34) synthesis GTPase MnmE [Bacteroidales bacterium]|nr:tRNA uridine-5-carboxymethylaminomethyl(34) synthesis GTPase MnmE [Bacteroidales bacterium]